eukprot:TRINITY_DN84649_c0_g1_i1.p1 TRINITY_DN84649_c0_g1~~TRINITY_DN84649_c0_g1_i1.p1  ORF type:complete len:256 (+),score=27.39 TRINITY_DN84649_c0_g1_i1:32-769(+)
MKQQSSPTDDQNSPVNHRYVEANFVHAVRSLQDPQAHFGKNGNEIIPVMLHNVFSNLPLYLLRGEDVVVRDCVQMCLDTVPSWIQDQDVLTILRNHIMRFFAFMISQLTCMPEQSQSTLRLLCHLIPLAVKQKDYILELGMIIFIPVVKFWQVQCNVATIAGPTATHTSIFYLLQVAIAFAGTCKTFHPAGHWAWSKFLVANLSTAVCRGIARSNLVISFSNGSWTVQGIPKCIALATFQLVRLC